MKCLFDNNMPPKLAKTLGYLEGDEGIPVEHLKDKFLPDTSDIDWIKKLSMEGGWFVITRDNHIRKRVHERKAWQESNIPIVFLEKSWIKINLWEMAWRLIKCWPNLKVNIKSLRKNESLSVTINGTIKLIS
jgi:predicted nuclease of predicted toxin-antitoxin system